MSINITINNRCQISQKINTILEKTSVENGNGLKSCCRLVHLLKGVRNTALCEDKDADFVTCDTKFQPLDFQLALIASDVYNMETMLDQSCSEFWRLTSEDLYNVGLEDIVLKDDSSGFQTNLYSNGHQVVLAFAGSNDLADWRANICETLGLPDLQYRQAVTLAKQVHKCFGERLVITGHSLGGSLATIAACTTESFAVTFNSAGLSESTLKRNNLDPERAKIRSKNGSIRTYNMQHDLLYGVQNWIRLLPEVLGSRIILKEPDNPSGKCSSINIAHFIEEHKMNRVVSAMPTSAT